MTLAPSTQLGPRLVPLYGSWVEYDHDPVLCGEPGCPYPAREEHHIEPRSRTARQPVQFVSIDGLVFPNTVRLCHESHVKVNGGIGGHRSRIVYGEVARTWIWQDRGENDEWITKGTLRGIVPSLDAPAPLAAGSSPRRSRTTRPVPRGRALQSRSLRKRPGSSTN